MAVHTRACLWDTGVNGPASTGVAVLTIDAQLSGVKLVGVGNWLLKCVLFVHLPIGNLPLKVRNQLVGLKREFGVFAGIVCVPAAGEEAHAYGKAGQRHEGKEGAWLQSHGGCVSRSGALINARRRSVQPSRARLGEQWQDAPAGKAVWQPALCRSDSVGWVDLEAAYFVGSLGGEGLDAQIFAVRLNPDKVDLGGKVHGPELDGR